MHQRARGGGKLPSISSLACGGRKGWSGWDSMACSKTVSTFVAAGDIADFGKVEIDIALVVVGEERVDGVGGKVLGQRLRVGKSDLEGFLVNAQYTVHVCLGFVEYIAKLVCNSVF